MRDDPALALSWNGDGFTPLHLSAFFGGVDGARVLLDAGAELDVVSRNDFSVYPIHSAAAGRVPVALLLVERGANVNVKQRHGWTPLHTRGTQRLRRAGRRAAGGRCGSRQRPTMTASPPRISPREAGHDAIVERLQARARSRSVEHPHVGREVQREGVVANGGIDVEQ